MKVPVDHSQTVKMVLYAILVDRSVFQEREIPARESSQVLVKHAKDIMNLLVYHFQDAQMVLYAMQEQVDRLEFQEQEISA